MIKLISLDLDGTLLSPNGTISKRNKQAILNAQKAGIKVIAATGRSFESAVQPFEEAQITCPIICVNGAERYSDERKRQQSIFMNKTIIDQLISIAERDQLFIEIYTNKGIYTQNEEQFFKSIKSLIIAHHPEISEKEVEKRVNKRLQDEAFIFTDSLTSLVNDPDINVLKALIFSFEADQLAEIKQKFMDRSDVIVTSSGPANLEFNHPDAQKGLALKAYATERGISLEDSMAIGDNDNDRSMLEVVGKSVAMGNAKESIKQIADTITATNEADGVAKAIESILT